VGYFVKMQFIAYRRVLLL